MRGFQMVVVVEGHGAAFRLTDHLAAGQVVLLRTAAGRLRDWAASRANNDTAARSELPWVEWFYPLMRPWVDYVPWSRDDDLRRAIVRLQKSRGVRPSICRVLLPMTLPMTPLSGVIYLPSICHDAIERGRPHGITWNRPPHAHPCARLTSSDRGLRTCILLALPARQARRRPWSDTQARHKAASPRHRGTRGRVQRDSARRMANTATTRRTTAQGSGQ